MAVFWLKPPLALAVRVRARGGGGRAQEDNFNLDLTYVVPRIIGELVCALPNGCACERPNDIAASLLACRRFRVRARTRCARARARAHPTPPSRTPH